MPATLRPHHPARHLLSHKQYFPPIPSPHCAYVPLVSRTLRRRLSPPRAVPFSRPFEPNTLSPFSPRLKQCRCIHSTSVPSSRRLHDKVALVTGASSGLGRAMALAFAREGASLVVCADLKPDAPVESWVPEGEKGGTGEGVSTHALICEEVGAGKAIFVRTDVGDEESVRGAVGVTVGVGGRLDVMVNNAGLGFEDVMMHEMPEETWDKLMRVNLRSVFLGCKHACIQFLKQDLDSIGHRGWIISTSSGAGLKGIAGGATAYCASKAAVINFTKAVALDYAPYKIHVNAICPGYVHTPMSSIRFQDTTTATTMKAETPWDRTGTPADVAKVAVFLASDDAGWVTGVAVPVDGGFAAR